MTDRIKGLTITLDNDYRDDDVQEIVRAISMIRGVAHVALHVTDFADHMARARVRSEFAADFVALVKKLHGEEPDLSKLR